MNILKKPYPKNVLSTDPTEKKNKSDLFTTTNLKPPT